MSNLKFSWWKKKMSLDNRVTSLPTTTNVPVNRWAHMLRVLSSPVFYALELTPFCDNTCPGCSNVFVADKYARKDSSLRSPLSFNEWRIVLDQLAPKAHRFKLTGGEPTLHPEFETIIRHIDALGIPFTLFTNARWHNPERLLNLLSQLPQFVGFLISLHGARAESHEIFTNVPGSFAETVENIQRATARGFAVTTSTVFTQANVSELPAIVKLSLELGAQHVVFNRYLGGEMPNISIPDNDLICATRLVDQMKTEGKPVKFAVCVPPCFTWNSSNGCLAGVAYCTIDPWGNLRPCTHSSLVAGNLMTQPLEEVWQSAEMERFRQVIPQECHSCGAFSSCHGGCKSLAMELGIQHDPLMRNPIAPRDMPPPPKLSLGAQMRPVRRYQIREETFGYILTRGNAVVPVRPAAWQILQALNGKMTLLQIKQTFGAEALSLIGSLYQHGLIEMRN
jgi:radical SAM protein with 4Fe4S-binding SPASM domain